MRLIFKNKIYSNINKNYMSQTIDLDNLNENDALRLLKNYTDKAFKEGKVFTIKDSSVLNKMFRLVTKSIVDPEITLEQAYNVIFKALDTGNSNGVFTLDEAVVIDRVEEWIKDNLIVDENPVQTEKIMEI